MDGLKLITHEDVTISLDDFYAQLTESINGAQRIWCPRGLNCDWLGRDALQLGIQVFPPRTYEILRALKEKPHDTDPGSRVEHPEAPGAA